MVLYITAVIAVTLFMMLKHHGKNRRISGEKDFIEKFCRKKELEMQKLGVSVPISIYLSGMLISPLLFGLFVFLLSKSAMLSVLFGVFGVFFPKGLLYLIAHSNEKKFEERYAKSLQQLSASLETGMSISSAVNDVANCVYLHESMRKRYAKLSSDLQMGLSISESFQRFADDTNSIDAQDVALAIDVQNEVGGHEADVIKGIAENIQNRIMLRREVSSIFAETSMIVWIFDFLPLVVMLGYSVLNIEFVNLYFSNPVYIVLFVLFISLPIVGNVTNHRTLNKIKKGVM